MLWYYGNKQFTLDKPYPLVSPDEISGPVAWWTHLSLKEEAAESTTAWQDNTRTPESLRGLRTHKVLLGDDTPVMNGPEHPTRPNRDARMYFDEVCHKVMFGINCEYIPHSRFGTEEELFAFDRFCQKVVDYIQLHCPTALIGGYFPWFDWSLAAKRHHGTITLAEHKRELRWWHLITRTMGDDSKVDYVAFLDRLHVLMLPFYGYGDLDPRWWVPECLQRLKRIDKDVYPHLWSYHKHRELPGKPTIPQDKLNFRYVCESIRGAGFKNAIMWLTGKTEQDWLEQQPYIAIARDYFEETA